MKHDTILQCLPDDYGKTLQAVQDHLTDEQMCIVLSSTDHNSANRAILDCLITQVNHMGNLLEFCDHLEKVLPLSTDQGLLTNVIMELKTSMYIHMLKFYSYTYMYL